MHCGLRLRSSLSFLLTGALGLAGMIASTQASATVVVLHSLERMSATAEVIVHARVGESRTLRENGRTVTLTEIEVLDGLKGAKSGDVLTVYQVGGVFEGQRTEVIGNYTYVQDEEMVLFAVQHGERIVGYGVGVGKYEVKRNARGVDVVATYGDVAVMHRAKGSKDRMGRPPVAVAQPLNGFLSTVRHHLANPIRIQKRVRKPHTANMLKRTKLRAPRGAPASNAPSAGTPSAGLGE